MDNIFKIVHSLQRNNTSMLKSIAQIDRKISRPIIQLDNLVVSIILYPFAALFHPKLIFLAYLSVYYFSGKNKYTTLVYLLGTGVCLISTTVLKKILNRPRPTLVKNAKKPSSFRSRQKNNSMPSGDAIQSAFFVAFLYFVFSQNAISSLQFTILVMVHVGVCLGRVYYMCHWVADTAVSTALGVGICYLMWNLVNNLGLKNNIQMLTGTQL